MKQEKFPQNADEKFENTKFKIKHSKRRMKIYIKLNKEETEAWKQVKEVASGGMGIQSDDQITKILFFRGINGFFEDLQERMDNMTDEEKAEMEKEANIQSSLGSEIEDDESDEKSN